MRYMAIVPAHSAVRSRRVRWAMLATGAAVLVADQVTKTLVLWLHPAAGTGLVTVRLVRNTGASGGIGAGYPVLVTLAAAVITCVAGMLAVRARGRGVAICLAAVLGGGAGNLSDRLFRSPGFGRGAVVDWIHIAGRGGSFNIADLAIQLGVLGALAALFISERNRRDQKEGYPRSAE